MLVQQGSPSEHPNERRALLLDETRRPSRRQGSKLATRPRCRLLLPPAFPNCILRHAINVSPFPVSSSVLMELAVNHEGNPGQPFPCPRPRHQLDSLGPLPNPSLSPRFALAKMLWVGFATQGHSLGFGALRCRLCATGAVPPVLPRKEQTHLVPPAPRDRWMGMAEQCGSLSVQPAIALLPGIVFSWG